MKKILRVVICKGLPASGKTSFAQEQVEKDQGNTISVCKDNLREMLHFNSHSKGKEELICQMRDQIILTGLENDKNVISSDTNFAPKHEIRIREIVKGFEDTYNKKVDIEIKEFDTPLNVCIERDSKRANSVGKKVIMQMYNQYLKPDPIVQDKTLDSVILVDIDGTIAKYGPGRGPFEWNRVQEDELNEYVAKIVNLYYNNGTKVIIFSGRDSICKNATIQWLNDKGVNFHEIYMRTEGDNRRDSIIKRELFDTYILNKYYVEAVFDDRPQVCNETWRELGLPLFQVGAGDNYEF